MSYYLGTLVVFFCSDAIFALGLNLQYGLAGILNWAYVLFYAVGAYVAGCLLTGSDRSGAAQSLGEHYLFGVGFKAPYVVAVLIGTLAGALLAALIGLMLRRSLKDDFGALATVAIFLILLTVFGAWTPLFNGYNGIALVPNPFGLASTWQYPAVSVAWLVLALVATLLIVRSPYGRLMRAIRERPEAAEALGRNVFRKRLVLFVVANAMAALAGAVLVAFVSAWSPLSWQFAETIVVYSAVIVGGRGSSLGAILGAAIVGVGINQATLFIPAIPSHPNLIPSLQWMVTALVILGFLWFRPQGLLPERKLPWRRIVSGTGPARRLRAPIARPPATDQMPS
jgi:branched-chain amino acid transport system permease protein